MKKSLIILAIAFVVPYFVQAQDMVDALRFSNIQTTGTARAGAMGNAFGALGGDFTSAAINPAGIALYRTSEFAFTPKFTYSSVEGNYMNTSMEDNKYNFALNNISYVTSIPTSNTSEVGLISLNLGIGYNRVKDFNSYSLAGASGVTSSFLDDLVENANGEDPNNGWSDFYEELAYYNSDNNSGADLMYYDEDAGFWRTDIQINPFDQTVNNHPVSQRKSISRSGSMDKYSFVAGLNFNHKLYVGASLGITDIYYKQSSTYEEWDAQGDIPNFESMRFTEYLRTTGTGYDFNFGIIYKPVNEVRLGASIQTPTFYNLHDFFHTSMYSRNNFEDGGITDDEGHSPYNNYDYNLETPLRATFSGAFVIAKKGIISVDYEYVDYSNNKLRKGGDGYNFTSENQEITETFKSVGNIRVGGELKATNELSLRAGYEFYPSAYKSESFGNEQFKSDDRLMTYTAGLGYRFGSFTFDIAYRLTDNIVNELPYSAPYTSIYPQPSPVEYSALNHDVIFTLGFKF
ncbi:outer membrane protein transport protein [uncultured Draconibacterium sp.]|uniref:OmpP1/FadL family transporter n=1 Tax=uncultured Draconibacterium sp. TaxID=1573823 RepID=UPI003216C416